MTEDEDAGLDFIEGFFLFAGVAWVVGAIALMALAALGAGRV